MAIAIGEYKQTKNKYMNKKIFVPCEIEFVKFSKQDIIATSFDPGCPTKDMMGCTSKEATPGEDLGANEIDF